MSNLLQTIKENFNGMILLGLNLFMAIYRPDYLFYIFNPIPGPFPPENSIGVDPTTFAFSFYIVTSGLMLIYLVFMFFPKLRLGRLIIDSVVIAIQIMLIVVLPIIFLDVATTHYFPLIYAVAGITLADRIFDIIVHGIASRKIKLKMISEVKGSEINVQV
ncbi:MAG: hypothetical protein ACTSPT_03760 [Candidatus Heimdallarchaeota archaeon]